jgi:uncharacterized protein involved in outer membrane biogenesis
MTKDKFKRVATVALIAIAVLVAAAMVGMHFAANALKSRVEQALGADSEVGEITVGWSAIEVRRVRIRAPKGWPAPDALRAQRIVIVPDLRGLLSARIRVQRITIEQAYLSVLRTRDGRLRLLPSLLETHAKPAASGSAAPAPAVAIGRIELSDGVLELFDATVRQPPYKVRLQQLHAGVENLLVPALTGRITLRLDGVVKGVQHDGKLAIDGWAELSSKNSEIKTVLHGVDLIALQPYLIKASETGVRRGTLDLDLKSTVSGHHLHAPGTITLTGLELATGGGAMGTFMGVPRQAVVASLKNSDDQIAVHFTLDGNIDDPHFSLNESFSKYIGTAVAATLGISIEGLTRGVGAATEGLGDVVKKMFGK